MADYIPRPDADFTIWLNNFTAYASDNQDSLSLTKDDIENLAKIQAEWQQTYEDYITAIAAADSAREQKADLRKLSEDTVRTIVRQLQSNPNLTNAQRAALNISIPETSRSTTGVPTTQPIAMIEQAGTLRHTIHFMDETTPNRKAKPKGVMGVQIFVNVGEPIPRDPGDFKFLGLDTRTPYTSQFDSDDAGKTAYYRLRWVNTKGEEGPWSQQYSAMIVG